MRTFNLVWALLFFVLLLAWSCQGDSGSGGDDDDDVSDEAYCDISGEGLYEVPFANFQHNCQENLGISLVLSNVLADPQLTVVEARGQYSIENDNSYFFRGEGLGSDLCFAVINNAGGYAIRAEFLSCTNNVTFSVVTSTDPGAIAFCNFSFRVDLECGGTDDDIIDDDVTDDDVIDDDVEPDDDVTDDDTGAECGPFELCAAAVDCGYFNDESECTPWYDEPSNCTDMQTYIMCNCDCLEVATDCDDWIECGTECFYIFCM